MKNHSKTCRGLQPAVEQLEDRCVPAILHVGVQTGELTLAQAAVTAQNGDTVQIDAGTYTNVAVTWTQNDLTIQGLGQVVLDDTGFYISDRKGIFVIVGTNTTIDNITFQGAHDSVGLDKNWAGIRQEGDNLTVNGCSFFNNDDGILGGGSTASNVLVEYSQFANNGYGDGYSHNMYIGNVATFTLEYSDSQDANQGHDVKSRANENILLYNFIGDSGAGDNDDASLIDLPNGGASYLIGNVLHKGADSGNGTLIDYGVEGNVNPDQSLYLVDNTVVNDRGSGTDALVSGSTTSTNLINNLFAGAGAGATTEYSATNGASATPATNQSNFSAVDPGFVNAADLDYQLTAGSAAIDAGVDPGSVSGFGNLTPTNEYVATANTQPRPVVGALDIGAYEYGTAVNQPPTIATPAAASAATVTETTVGLSVLGADDGGEANLTYTWTVSGPSGVAFSANGSNAAQATTATFTQAGNYTFTATVQDAGGLSVSSTTGTVTVVQTASGLTVTPAAPTVADGATQQFTAAATDQFGNPIANPAVTWTASLGSVSATGLYTAPDTGTGSDAVTAALGSLTTTATVTLLETVPTVAAPATASSTTVSGVSVGLSVLGAENGSDAGLTYSWSVSGPTAAAFSANGTNAAKAITATFTQAGSYTFTAVITDAAGQSVSSTTGTVTVVQTATGLTVSPTSATVSDGATKQFTATFVDQFGNAIANPAVIWTAAGLGTVSSTGLYTAPATGSGSATVTADSGAATASATVSVTAAAAGLQDAGFEQPVVGTGAWGDFRYDPTGTAWHFTGNAGVAGNGSGFTAGNPNTPQGVQVAFLQESGSASQSFTLAAGTYTVNFAAAQRGNYQASSQTFQVLFDGQVIGTFTPSSPTYASYSTARFTASAGTHTLTFEGINPNGGDNTAFIDRVSIKPATAPIVLQVSEDAYQGNAKYVVLVDGQQIGGVRTATASHALGQTQTVTLSGQFAVGPHTIAVEFLNDDYDGSSTKDRNLYVDGVDFAGVDYSGTSLFSDGTASAQIDAPGGASIVWHWN